MMQKSAIFANPSAALAPPEGSLQRYQVRGILAIATVGCPCVCVCDAGATAGWHLRYFSTDTFRRYNQVFVVFGWFVTDRMCPFSSNFFFEKIFCGEVLKFRHFQILTKVDFPNCDIFKFWRKSIFQRKLISIGFHMGFLGNRDFSRSDENQIWDSWETNIFEIWRKSIIFDFWKFENRRLFVVVENSFSLWFTICSLCKCVAMCPVPCF